MLRECLLLSLDGLVTIKACDVIAEYSDLGLGSSVLLGVHVGTSSDSVLLSSLLVQLLLLFLHCQNGVLLLLLKSVLSSGLNPLLLFPEVANLLLGRLQLFL